MSALSQYNEFIRAANQRGISTNQLIGKALTTATNSGGALIPEQLEQVITNTAIRLVPEIAILQPEPNEGKRHDFNRLTSLPAVGGAIGENAATPVTSSTFARDSVELKIVRRKGKVTNFLQSTSRKYLDTAGAEMQNHIRTQSYELSFYNVWGNEGASTYTWNGVLANVTNTVNQTILAQGGTQLTSLEEIDALIDAANENEGSQHRRALLMSTRMLSRFSRLLENVRLNQGLTGNGLSTVQIPGGWRMFAYRDVPILESSMFRPKAQMGAVMGAAVSDPGGTIPDATYDFRVAPFTLNGEELASSLLAVVVNTGGANDGKITLSWAAHLLPQRALYYGIYCSIGGGQPKLVRMVDAFTRDSEGAPTGEVTSTIFLTNPVVAGASVPVSIQQWVPLVGSLDNPPETIMLWDLDRIQGLGKFVFANQEGSEFKGLITMKPLAETDDFINFLIKTYGTLVPAYGDTSSYARGYKTKP